MFPPKPVCEHDESIETWARGVPRCKGDKFIVAGEIRIWNGKIWHCKHDRRKDLCVECEGSGICEHNKQLRQCKTCGGNSYCEHGTLRSYCKIPECGGKSICEHGVQKSVCKKCDGVSICEHGIVRSICKQCVGGSVCEHGRVKSGCKACGGSQICQHGKYKSGCVECDGSNICEHKKLLRNCKECGGKSYCEHGKFKYLCKPCDGRGLCKAPFCEITVGSTTKQKYNGYCLRCCVYLCPEIPVIRNYKTKENEVVSLIKRAFPDQTWFHDIRIQDGCSLRRPDLRVDMGSHVIIVEVDEYAHSSYDSSCENFRLMQISKDIGYRPLVCIRFNPDKYTTSSGETITSCWKTNKRGIYVIAKRQTKRMEYTL